jgi:hypothetical protein
MGLTSQHEREVRAARTQGFGNRTRGAHRVNTRVRTLAPRFNPEADFICECGCSQLVRLSIEEYDALEGAPVYGDGHPLSAA